VTVAVERDATTSRRPRSERLFRQLLGPAATIARRPDGKPESDTGRTLTASHAGDWTIAAAGLGVIACDIEPVASRPDPTWRDMLGPDRWELARLIARTTGETSDQAATRVWVAGECLTKAGISARAPLVLGQPAAGRAVVVHSGELRIATLPLPDGPEPGRPPLMFGFLTR
jgi:enediyne polyketide synthase